MIRHINFVVLVTSLLIPYAGNAGTLNAAQKKCAQKIVQLQREEFAKSVSDIDGEVFSLKRVTAKVLGINLTTDKKTLEVTTQVSGARMQSCYYSSAVVTNNKCVLSKKLVEFECENDDFIFFEGPQETFQDNSSLYEP